MPIEYGAAYLELNQAAIERLTAIMGPDLAAVALEMAPQPELTLEQAQAEEAEEWAIERRYAHTSSRKPRM